jgi:hypothetical protein
MNKLPPILIALALLASPLIAAAQTKAADAFAAVMQNAGHKAAVMDSAKQSPAWSHMACPSASFSPAPEVGVYAPIEFNPAGQPVAGEWREGVIATGCGTSVTLNVLTKVTAPATLASGPLLPGGTIADPILQNNAQINAVAAAGGIPASCKDAYIANTSFGGYEGAANTAPPKAGQSAPWRETWTISLCGTTKNVVLHFTPTADGVSIKTNPAETTSG